MTGEQRPAAPDPRRQLKPAQRRRAIALEAAAAIVRARPAVVGPAGPAPVPDDVVRLATFILRGPEVRP